jgi:hypothetical protein
MHLDPDQSGACLCQMAQPDSAVARTPVEIWFKILDHLIDVPEYFDATCEGSFSEFWQSSADHQPFFQSLNHLKKIKKVCRLWESFAAERAIRLVDVTYSQLHHPIKVVRRAHAANIRVYNYDALHCSTLWRKVTITTEGGEEAAVLIHMAENSRQYPHLRRIYLNYTLQDTVHLTYLSHFDNITLLSLRLAPPLARYPHLNNQVTLARVEILFGISGMSS